MLEQQRQQLKGQQHTKASRLAACPWSTGTTLAAHAPMGGRKPMAIPNGGRMPPIFIPGPTGGP